MSTTGASMAQRLLADQIEPFLQHLRDAGYAERTLRKKRTVARAFARWANGKGIATIDLNYGHVHAFVLRLPRGGQSRRKFELAAVQMFLSYLCATAGLQCPSAEAPVSFTGSVLQQYENHLRKDRGLAENSLRVYRAPGPCGGLYQYQIPSGGGMDVRADSDVVPLQHSGRRERPGMAGPTDGQGRVEVPATGELFCVDRRLRAGPEAAEPGS
jgi:hypothetical protein